jgi:hypothetical protein
MPKKRHHYIPRFYLKGFTLKNEVDKIWVYPKNGDHPYVTNIANVALENHFYSTISENNTKDSNTIEDYLAQKIEQPANPVIHKMRHGSNITYKEKRILSKYLMGIFTRVPYNRERVKRSIPNISKYFSWHHASGF